MTAAPGNPLEKAKQGNPQALAALIGRSMKSQGIDVDVTRDEGTIHVWLEADKVPNPQAAVSFIRKGMSNLGIRNVDTVKVYGKPRDADTPLWQEEFALAPPAPPRSQAPRTPPPPEVPPTADLPPDEPLVAEDSLPDDLLEDSDFPEELVDDDPIPLPGETLPMAIEDDDMDVESEGFEEDEDGVEEAPPEKKSKALSPVLLGLLVLVALGAVGFFLWPQIQAYLPPIPLLGGGESEEDPETIPEATGEAPAAAPPAEGTPAATGEAPAAAPPAEGTPEATGEAPAAQETPATPGSVSRCGTKCYPSRRTDADGANSRRVAGGGRSVAAGDRLNAGRTRRPSRLRYRSAKGRRVPAQSRVRAASGATLENYPILKVGAIRESPLLPFSDNGLNKCVCDLQRKKLVVSQRMKNATQAAIATAGTLRDGSSKLATAVPSKTPTTRLRKAINKARPKRFSLRYRRYKLAMAPTARAVEGL